MTAPPPSRRRPGFFSAGRCEDFGVALAARLEAFIAPFKQTSYRAGRQQQNTSQSISEVPAVLHAVTARDANRGISSNVQIICLLCPQAKGQSHFSGSVRLNWTPIFPVGDCRASVAVSC